MDHPLLLGGEAVEYPTKFSKRGGWQDFKFKNGAAGKEGVTYFRRVSIFTKKNKLKAEIFNNKKNL